MKFTRRQVLEAIRSENLVSNSDQFCTYESFTLTSTCKVCAVGGLLRRAGISLYDIDTVAWRIMGENTVSAGQNGDEYKALQNKDYILALSVKFEKIAKKYGTGKRTRQKLASFVKANFPTEFDSIRN